MWRGRSEAICTGRGEVLQRLQAMIPLISLKSLSMGFVPIRLSKSCSTIGSTYIWNYHIQNYTWSLCKCTNIIWHNHTVIHIQKVMFGWSSDREALCVSTASVVLNFAPLTDSCVRKWMEMDGKGNHCFTHVLLPLVTSATSHMLRWKCVCRNSSSLELKVRTQIQALTSMDEKCKPEQTKFSRN